MLGGTVPGRCVVTFTVAKVAGIAFVIITAKQ
jgi:hypothetical protein